MLFIIIVSYTDNGEKPDCCLANMFRGPTHEDSGENSIIELIADIRASIYCSSFEYTNYEIRSFWPSLHNSSMHLSTDEGICFKSKLGKSLLQ